MHIYYTKIRFKPDILNRPIVLSEYGGYGCFLNRQNENKFYYFLIKNKTDLTLAIKNLIKNDLYPNLEKGLCASVYTQLSDVEEEVNGFLTYDRKILKVDLDEIQSVNKLLKFNN